MSHEVERLVQLLEAWVVSGSREARWAFEDAAEAATVAEVREARDRVLEAGRILSAEYDRQRQAEVDSGLDDWAFAFVHGIRWEP